MGLILRRNDFVPRGGCPILAVFARVGFHGNILKPWRQSFRIVGVECRNWTVQRADVDNFYGRAFESDFVDIQYQGQQLTGDVIADPLVSKKLRPKIHSGGEKVQHFVATGPVPSHFTEVHVNGPNGPIRLGLKIRPDRVVISGGFPLRRHPPSGAGLNAQGCPSHNV